MVDGGGAVVAKPSARTVKLTDLVPDSKNANQGTVRGLAMLEDSLREHGAGRGILLDRNNNIIAGNKTVERAVDLGFEEIIVVPTDGKQLVATQRVDVDLDTPEGRRLALLDNRVSEVDLSWNPDVLKELQSEIDLSALFDTDELDAILASVGGDEPPSDPGAAIDRAETLREKYSVEKGQLWQIGRHRLLCGDAYSSDDVARLLHGAKPDMLHIDPPYGINAVKPENASNIGQTNGRKRLAPGFTRGATARETADGAERSIGATRGARRTALIIQPNEYPVIEGDDRPFDAAPFVGVAPIVIMWGANYYADQLPISPCWIVWDKREDITRNDFADCELAWCSLSKPARCFHHLWNGLHKGSQHGERRLHPTEKPVALFEEIGKMYADGGLWIDLFAGSGAQMVAAERTGATCYAMECEVLYVATIIERLAGMGLTPERVG